MCDRAADAKSCSRIDSLDGVRGIAAVIVVAYHLWLSQSAPSELGGHGFLEELVRQSGRSAVFMFFVLSGFLVGRPFTGWLIDPIRSRRPGLRAYTRSRLLRVFPLWLLVLAIVLIAQRPPEVQSPADIALLASLQSIYEPDLVRKVVGPAWTLSVELTFYLLLPIAALAASRALAMLQPAKRIKRVIGALAVVIASVGLLRQWHLDGQYWPVDDTRALSWSLPLFADMFAVGLIVAVLVSPAFRPSQVPITRRTFWLLGLLAGVIALAAVAGRSLLQGFQPTVVALACGLLLYALLVAAPAPRRQVLTARPLVYLGLISYGLYLWHVPILIEAEAIGASGWLGRSLVVAIVVLTSLALAAASWRYVEQPALRRARRPLTERRISLSLPFRPPWLPRKRFSGSS